MSKRLRAVRAMAADESGDTGDIEDRLLVAVGRGDAAAFEGLYDRVSAAVYGLTKRVLRDAAQAEEVAQEVFVELWRTAPRYDPARGRARTWCLTLAHRRAVDRVRSEVSARRREVAAAEPVADDLTYELWRLGGERIEAVGLFRPDDDGVVLTLIESGDLLAGGRALAVTVEDAGGADQPTGEIVFISPR